MSENKPLKIMYLNPLASSASYNSIFADMARDHKLPQTEVHVASLPESEGGFTHIEFRAYEAMVTRGNHPRRARRSAREVSTRWRSGVSTTRRCTTRARFPAA